MKDAVTCCELAGVEPPESALTLEDVTVDAVPFHQDSHDNVVSFFHT